ncbi:condensin subunit Smc [Eubacterium ruminantium]|uniref:Chromosome partition protein Smc n=1 Tax=Eubacterium ruminantium TaxID=42322 RepID=A0A1T4M5U3_9FIRM|nr:MULTISPECIES: chromosome segregation protein SMC [Eubacterium]MCR5368841.1 chromosome segregation protein SMC [Eubacterium sp.]SCW36675.1 condensin subunit Smc [Eubacterium ruminantium]SDM49159.1 condensin subunit Smc [Eubacterium ruminantium]SJZ62390.1 condensin subunit Smc [Eubacterium ruminantium]
MYLKSIEVNGFKSFANKIDFKFNNGITAIVGPNGSGKSNVADAVRWVLGEQSAKNLRGAKMEDVIFAGTELRKPQGSAYVAITLDNSDHKLPVDYNEVTVARRVYRSGESEYLINGTVTRLKDVTKLFFDTGIGKEGYSIIGQGKIEQILSGKPEEKRELFDEAAGIVKYKKNKAATEKALLSEHQNLSRVNDILSELEGRVGPLERQSEKARKYLAYKEKLKGLEVSSFLIEIKEINALLEKYEQELKIMNDDSDRLKSEFEHTRQQYDELEKSVEELDAKIEAARNDITDKKLENEKADGEIRVLTEQISSENKNKELIVGEISRIRTEIERLSGELRKYKNDKDNFSSTVSSAEKEVADKKKECDELESKIFAKEEEIENAKGEIIDFINEGGTLKAKVGRYDTMLENISLRKTELRQKYLSLKSDEEKFTEEKKRFADSLRNASELLRDNQEKHKNAENGIKNNTEEAATVKSDITKYNQMVISLRSRHDALVNLTERYEGYGNSIKKVMEQKEKNKGIVGVVADIIKVQSEYEIAIETSLGGSIQNIVTDTDETAKKMIRFLKENKLGRATFLPASKVVAKGSVTPEALKEKGVIGIASKLVTVDSKYQNIVDNLLGRSIVVDNIDNASRIAAKFNQSLRLVTLEGELINPGGSMTGGAFKNQSNLLGRKRELDQLSEDIKKASVKLQEARQKETELLMRRESLKEERDRLNQVIQRQGIEENTLRLSLENATRSLDETLELFEAVKKENIELDEQVKDINVNKDELFDEGKQKENAIEERKSYITTLESEVNSLRESKKHKDEELASLSLKAGNIKQQSGFIDQNIERINNEIERTKGDEKSYLDRLDQSGSNSESFKIKIDELSGIKKSNDKIISENTEKLEALVNEKDKVNKKHKEFLNRREELTAEIGRMDKAIFTCNNNIEKVTEKKDGQINYMWEEYELTYSAASQLVNENSENAADELSRSALKKEIATVKSDIKGLGDVNVNAIEEYKEVSERYNFLSAQRDDIVEAEDNLKNIIAELEKAMKDTFNAKFKDIQEMFQKVFHELFGGGKATLSLVDEEDILESGIIINAQPPGKKLQNMMQLSGGEKSLTAIALLFAIQSLKPSPFCLLDEIEAALDDSNVKRFAKYLDKLTKDTQFIVITHRRGTMESADILYGITMQEKGVSTLVSVNLIEDKLDD